MVNYKKLITTTLIGAIATTVIGCGATVDVKNFTLSATMFTTIDGDKTEISTTLVWPALLGIKYYRVMRKTNDGDAQTLDPPEIANTETSYNDKGLAPNSSYTYIIKAYDSKDNEIPNSRKETPVLTPIAAQIPETTVNPFKDNKVNDESTFSWSKVEGVDLYYAQIKDPQGKLVLGAYTNSDTTQISLNNKQSLGKDKIPATLLAKLPIETTVGIKVGNCYEFRVVTIKGDGDLKTAKAIGIRYSKPVQACWMK